MKLKLVLLSTLFYISCGQKDSSDESNARSSKNSEELNKVDTDNSEELNEEIETEISENNRDVLSENEDSCPVDSLRNENGTECLIIPQPTFTPNSIISIEPPEAKIGEGYDSESKSFLGENCVAGNIEIVHQSRASMLGFYHFSMPEYSGVVSAKLDQKITQALYDDEWSRFSKSVNARTFLLKFDVSVVRDFELSPTYVKSLCGDSFIFRKNRGLIFSIMEKYEIDPNSTKTHPRVITEEYIKSLTPSEKINTKMKLRFLHVGGNVSKIAERYPDGLPECSGADMKACTEAKSFIFEVLRDTNLDHGGSEHSRWLDYEIVHYDEVFILDE